MSHSESTTASVAMTRTLAFLVYDFRASGVVRNTLRIAAAAREAGLDGRRHDFAWVLAGVWLHAIAKRARKLGVWSRGVVIRLIVTAGGRSYGAGSTRERPHD